MSLLRSIAKEIQRELPELKNTAVEEILRWFLGYIREAVRQGYRVKIKGLGTFGKISTYTGRESAKVVFKPEAQLFLRINKDKPKEVAGYQGASLGATFSGDFAEFKRRIKPSFGYVGQLVKVRPLPVLQTQTILSDLVRKTHKDDPPQ